MVLGGVLAAASIASADPDQVDQPTPGTHWRPEAKKDVWIDVGLGVQTVAPGDNVRYTGEMIRFAPQAAFGKHFYLGAGFSATRISDTSGSTSYVQCPSNYTDEMCEGLQHDSTSSEHGTILEPQVVLGLRERAGIFVGAVELAPTMRFTNGNFTKNGLLSVTIAQKTVEAHGRIDAWFTPYLTVGAFAGIDVDSVNNLQAALQIGVHFYPYDIVR